MKNKILRQHHILISLISAFFAFLFWLLLSLNLQIIDLSTRTKFNVAIGIFAIIGLILLSIYMQQTLRKAILGSIMLATVLLSFFLVLVEPLDILDSAAEGYPPRCEIASPNGQKTFAVKARIPSDGASDIGWIYYKNLPFMGKVITTVRYCNSRWIDNDTIVVPANSYYGTPEQTVYAGIKFNWFSLPTLVVIFLSSYFTITLFEFFLRIIKNGSHPPS